MGLAGIEPKKLLQNFDFYGIETYMLTYNANLEPTLE